MDAVRAALAERALFWLDLVEATSLAPEDVLAALWELVWAGRGDERLVGAAPGAPPVRAAATGAGRAAVLALTANGRVADPGPLVQHLVLVRQTCPTAGRSPSFSSSGRGS